MAFTKKKKKRVEDSEFDYHVEKVLGVISENANTPWGKYVITARNGDDPSTTDIRSLRRGSEAGTFEMIGRGIALNGFEIDTLTNILLKNGFGTTEALEEELERRKSMYGLENTEEE